MQIEIGGAVPWRGGHGPGVVLHAEKPPRPQMESAQKEEIDDRGIEHVMKSDAIGSRPLSPAHAIPVRPPDNIHTAFGNPRAVSN